MTNIIHKLSSLFERFPGIGPRQARRFVYALIDEKEETVRELADALLKLKGDAKRCKECFRVFEHRGDICSPCSSSGNSSTLLVVERDIDLENVEKVGVYDGLFHVLGGLISPLNPESQKNLRMRELFERVKKSSDIKEIILATSATTEGDATASYVARILEELLLVKKIKITRLGRGLSTGTSLEFSDRDTLRNALNNRK